MANRPAFRDVLRLDLDLSLLHINVGQRNNFQDPGTPLSSGSSGRRKATLREAGVEMLGRFTEDVLPFDAAAASLYPEIVDRRVRQGTPISGYDAQIAAICRANDASLATGDGRDFADLGVELIDPWSSG